MAHCSSYLRTISHLLNHQNDHHYHFDDLMGDEHSTKFEGKINETMSNFNPDLDVVADYGDAIIFAMMIFYLSERFEGFPVARFSNKRNEYVVREISTDQFLVESK